MIELNLFLELEKLQAYAVWGTRLEKFLGQENKKQVEHMACCVDLIVVDYRLYPCLEEYPSAFRQGGGGGGS